MNLEHELGCLNGYLKAIEIATGRKVRLVANVLETTNDTAATLASFLEADGVSIGAVNISRIDREEFMRLMWHSSRDLLVGLPSSVVGDMEWQLEECFGLISTSMSDTNPFNPLFDLPLYSARPDGLTDMVVLLVEFPQLTLAVFREPA